MACTNPACAHPKMVCKLSDGDGWYTYRPCVLPAVPLHLGIVQQQDKVSQDAPRSDAFGDRCYLTLLRVWGSYSRRAWGVL